MAVAFAGQKVVIYTSHQTRTRETAKIISDAFGNALVEEHTRLSSWEGDLPQKQKQDILELVESGAGKCDVMILVTHMEVIDMFPTFWGLRRGVVIRETMDNPKGSARVFDAETGREEAQIRP
jgi:phosphohistidine phosphatase SixA